MIKFINSNIMNISNINSFINKLFKVDEPIFMLGRWCHINVPNCNHDVILKKIDFANSDNNLSYKTNKTNKIIEKKSKHSLTPQEYIDGFNN